MRAVACKLAVLRVFLRLLVAHLAAMRLTLFARFAARRGDIRFVALRRVYRLQTGSILRVLKRAAAHRFVVEDGKSIGRLHSEVWLSVRRSIGCFVCARFVLERLS